ncbi:MAG: hypothetical protein ACYC09_08835 [Bacteroidota bacterium]
MKYLRLFIVRNPRVFLFTIKKQLSQLIILCCLLHSGANGQQSDDHAIFADVSVGKYIPIFNVGESVSNSGMTYRGGLGVQLYRDYIINGRIMYFSTQGVPLVRYSIGEGNYLVFDGDMEYKHWVTIIALQYILMHEGDFRTGINGGILFMTATKTETSVKYNHYTEERIENVVGGFLGGDIEWMIPRTGFSVTGDVHLSYSAGEDYKNGSGGNPVFAGFTAMIGIRYYIQI